MSINVKIGSAPQPVIQDTTIGVSINTTPKVGVIINNPHLHEIKFKLNIREAHNGDLMIFDHPDIDIVIMVEKQKVVTFAKEINKILVITRGEKGAVSINGDKIMEVGIKKNLNIY